MVDFYILFITGNDSAKKSKQVIETYSYFDGEYKSYVYLQQKIYLHSPFRLEQVSGLASLFDAISTFIDHLIPKKTF